MPSGWSAARSRSSRLFLPQARATPHGALLAELHDEPVSSGRGCSAPYGVKRNLSNFPLRRGHRSPDERLDYTVQSVA